jgi:hypothetical protein
MVRSASGFIRPLLPTTKAATPDTAGADMLVPATQQTFRVVVPRQLLTTMSKTQQGCVTVVEVEGAAAGLMASVQFGLSGLGDNSAKSPPGPERSIIEFPKFEYEARRSNSWLVEIGGVSAKPTGDKAETATTPAD